MDRSPCHGSVTAQTKYWGKFVPLLGLVEDLDSEFRIYVLECESQAFGSPSTWYVGVEHRSQIARRVQTQFAQTHSAAHFCRVNKPNRIEFVMFLGFLIGFLQDLFSDFYQDFHRTLIWI